MLFSAYVLAALGVAVHGHPTAEHHDDHHDSEAINRVLDATAKALGGRDVLNQIDSFTYSANTIFRTHTPGQNYNLFPADQTVASAGSQNMSFSGSKNGLKSRIDRAYRYDYYWAWGRPTLEPGMGFSVVVQDGKDGFACFNKGQNSFYVDDPSKPLGYADAFLSDYLVHQSHQYALPWLMKQFMQNSGDLRMGYEKDPVTEAVYIALEYPSLELSLLIDTKTHLPTIVRSHEDHAVYGKSTNDLLLTNWTRIDVGQNAAAAKMLHPHRIQTVYNSKSVLEDFVLDKITINEAFPEDYFNAHPPPPNPEMGQMQLPKDSRPMTSPDYPRSEVHEFFESGLWSGPFGEAFNVSDVRTFRPVKRFDKIQTLFVGYADYVQLLVEFEDGLLITDAPAHRSKIVLEWIEKNMKGKRVKYVVPSHHHRDHAGGVSDYINVGATLVIPEVAKKLYDLAPGSHKTKIQTYSEKKPFMLKDRNVQFTSFFNVENPHAEDWTFAIASPAKPSKGDSFVLYNADVINPGTDAVQWDTGAAREVLKQAVQVGLPQSAILVGAHGSTDNEAGTTDTVQNIGDIIGFPYPPLTVADWNKRGKCLS